jgi:hypothetical protein
VAASGKNEANFLSKTILNAVARPVWAFVAKDQILQVGDIGRL